MCSAFHFTNEEILKRLDDKICERWDRLVLNKNKTSWQPFQSMMNNNQSQVLQTTSREWLAKRILENFQKMKLKVKTKI